MITAQEIERLKAPFPLNAHSIREGNKVRGGKGIQWFIYVDKVEVEKRLNEIFPGEWGSTVPVLYPMPNGFAATIGISIRGITRGNTGEDTNGTEKAKGATTDAFRRAANEWGIALYIYDMDFKIYTDAYPEKDYDAMEARKKEAFAKFAEWYKRTYGNKQQQSVAPPKQPVDAPASPPAGAAPTQVISSVEPPKAAGNAPNAPNPLFDAIPGAITHLPTDVLGDDYSDLVGNWNEVKDSILSTQWRAFNIVADALKFFTNEHHRRNSIAKHLAPDTNTLAEAVYIMRHRKEEKYGSAPNETDLSKKTGKTDDIAASMEKAKLEKAG